MMVPVDTKEPTQEVSASFSREGAHFTPNREDFWRTLEANTKFNEDKVRPSLRAVIL